MADVAIERLGKFFGPTRVLEDVNCEIEDGHMLCLLGPSGCGKTTTLRCVGGFETVDEGEIRIGGDVLSRPGYMLPPERRDTGVIFQAYGIWPHMTVGENVAFGLKIKGFRKKAIEEKVAEALQFVGLGGFEGRNATQLSGGQQQRLAIARSIVVEPQVLLFDEPLSNLDAKLRERMRTELASMQRSLGVTSVYVTHDQVEAMTIGDRIAVMHGGRIVEIGAPKQLYDSPTNEFTARFLGAANIWTGELARHSKPDGDVTVAILRGGHELELEDRIDTSGRGDVLLMARPSTVWVVPRTGGRGSSGQVGRGITRWEARIVNVAYVGPAYEVSCVLEDGETEVQAHVPAHSAPDHLAAGELCYLEIPADCVRILDESSSAPLVESTEDGHKFAATSLAHISLDS